MQNIRLRESDPDKLLSQELAEIRQLAEDHSLRLWSESRYVQTVIQQGLARESHYDRAVEAIFAMIGFTTTEASTQIWFEPIVELVEQHASRTSKTFETGFCEVTRAFRKSAGTYVTLNALPITNVYDLFEAYIKLIKLLTYRQGIDVSPALFDQVHGVNKRLNDRIENARLQQTLALYYTHNSDFELAERYALLAYTESEFLDDAGGIADAACTLAIIYRSGPRFQRADFYIQRAIDRVPTDSLDKRYATLYYEHAANAYRQDKFELALSNYRRALRIYEAYEAAYQIAMTQQAMAQAHLHLGEFSQAETCLKFARNAWVNLGNWYEHVNSFFVEADLEFQRGNRKLALKLLHQTIDRAYTELGNTLARQRLIDLITEHIEKNFGLDS
jgi:tetratricopeptide (TPR) repeat protein